MKTNSIIELSKITCNKSIRRVSILFFIFFTYFSFDRLYFTNIEKLEVFFKGTSSYLEQLILSSDSFEISRNLNSFIKSGQIDEYLILGVNEEIIAHNFKQFPLIDTKNPLSAKLIPDSLNYFITKKFKIKKDYTIFYAKEHSLIPVFIYCLIFLTCLGISYYIIKKSFDHLATSLSVPISNYSSFLKHNGGTNDIEFKSYSSNISEINDINNIIIQLNEIKSRQNESEIKLREVTALSRVATQVHHDIQSPLAVIRMITDELNTLPEGTKNILLGTIGRIKDIANNILPHKSGQPKFQTHLISNIVEEIVSEKRTELRNKDGIIIEFHVSDPLQHFANFDQALLKRIISNIINNSVESFSCRSGKIVITLASTTPSIRLTITDNGMGIPEEILTQLGEESVTFGKTKMNNAGSGLGLFHAFQTVQSWAGKLEISSKVNSGTEISIILPKQEKPSWYKDKISIKLNQKLIILDDDISVHQIWKAKLEKTGSANNLEILHFFSPLELEEWLVINKEQDFLLLCDYEFHRFELNGLEIIEKHNISSKSILVTAGYYEQHIQNQCINLTISLIPKNLISLITFNILPSNEIDLVHIDDDHLLRMSWRIKAEKNNKKILSFSSEQNLLKELSSIPKEVPFYIDSSLGSYCRKGEDLAKYLYDLGFHNLYLSTGFSKNDFGNMYWLKDIVKKEAPF